MSDARVEARGVAKDYPRAGASGGVLTAVRPLDLELGSGSLTVITGRSGSGKSTLLSMLAGMLAPTSGTVLLDGANLYSLDERSRSRLRNAKIGLVPQGHTALRALSVLDNVLLPSVLYSRRRPPRQRAEDLLEALEIRAAAPVEACPRQEVGPHAQLPVEQRVLEDDSQAVLDIRPVPYHVHRPAIRMDVGHGAGRGPQKRGEHGDRRGLPRSIGTEEREQ